MTSAPPILLGHYSGLGLYATLIPHFSFPTAPSSGKGLLVNVNNELINNNKKALGIPPPQQLLPPPSLILQAQFNRFDINTTTIHGINRYTGTCTGNLIRSY